LLLVIGEETKKIDRTIKAPHVTVPWRQMAGMRDFLAHDYRGVNAEPVFNTSKRELLPLKSILLPMLDEVDYEPAALKAALDSPHYSHIQCLCYRLNDESES
jgi:uncharacterized protein with HEPN domain